MGEINGSARGGALGHKAVREIRLNPFIPAESVLVATARSMRSKKEDTPRRDIRKHVETCPFRRRNEDKAPPELMKLPETGDWEVRLMHNLYPVLGDDREMPGFVFGLQQTIEGYGRHEVFVDHTDHGAAIHEWSPEHLARVFRAYRDRIGQLFESDKRLKCVLVFKNIGPAAGGSIPHSQVIAMPVVPENVHALRQPLRVGGAHPAPASPERLPWRLRRGPGSSHARHHGSPGCGDRGRAV